MLFSCVLRNNATLNNKPETYRQKRCRGTKEEHRRGKAKGFVWSTEAKAGSRGGAPPSRGRRFHAEHRGGAEGFVRSTEVRPRRTTEAAPRNQGGPPPRARPTRNGSTAGAGTEEWEHREGGRRGTTKGKADAEEWEHCRGRRRGMGALPRPRNGSTI
jgi:hypothetical protein